ncbi:MAG: GNAT family N-acetyltransferase [Alkalibacterium sp.]|nr:GNAT family N-acetyltransferase [Alkalibacterium sp.]
MITLKRVDETNWREVIQLEVDNTQKSFIESNSQSLLEAAYDGSLRWHPFAAYSQEECIGFVMIGAYDPEEKWIWLDRVMLAKKFQGKGLGTELLDEVVRLITNQWDAKEIILSVTPDNEDAIGFYTAYGFEWLDKVDPANGEQLMRLNI